MGGGVKLCILCRQTEGQSDSSLAPSTSFVGVQYRGKAILLQHHKILNNTAHSW